MIEFLQDIEVEVIEQFDEELDEIKESTWEKFTKGEKVDADLVSDADEPSIQIQFPDGSVTWLPNGSFKEIADPTCLVCGTTLTKLGYCFNCDRPI